MEPHGFYNDAARCVVIRLYAVPVGPRVGVDAPIAPIGEIDVAVRWVWYARMVGQAGGGIFALRRPRPYSRALAGRALHVASHPLQPHASTYGNLWPLSLHVG